jgi:hypothetical protein
VGVDEAGADDVARAIDHFGRAQAGADGGDPGLPDADVRDAPGRARPVHEAAALQHAIERHRVPAQFSVLSTS